MSAHARLSRLQRAEIAAAAFAGTVSRITRPARRTALSAVPAAGVAAFAAGLGELAAHIWHRGLAPWVAMTVVGAVIVHDVWEANRPRNAPRREDADA